MRKWMKKFAVTLTILLVILGNYGLPIFSLVVQADDSISFTTEIIEDAQTHEQSVRITGIEGNVEPSDHTLVIPEQIIVGETTYDVTEIGDQAFIGKHLTNVTFLGEKLRKIGNYAFADNQLTSLTLPDSLKEIGEYAFRDNELEHLALTHVTTLGKQAFANNKLKTIQLGEVATIGDEVFTNNQLTTVEIGNAVTSFGKGVFGFNNRFVEVKTTNPLIQNEVVANNGYGHVVNPVTVTVEFLKSDGTKLTEDQTIGSDFYDYNGVIMLGKENTYKPQAMLGYMPEQSEIKYTPDSTSYVLKVRYIEFSNPTIKENKPLSIPKDSVLTKEQILSFFTIKDFKGNDLSNRAIVTPDSINSAGKAESDKISVNITVTDDYNKSTNQNFDFVVAPDILDFPLGKILANDTQPYSKEHWWTLRDFKYGTTSSTKNSVTGLSNDGKAKLAAYLGNTQHDDFQVIIPHINPTTGETITKLGSSTYDEYGVYQVDGQTIVQVIDRITDYAGNITTLGEFALSAKNTRLRHFDENTFPNLKVIEPASGLVSMVYASVALDSSVTRIAHNNLENISSSFIIRDNTNTKIRKQVAVDFPNLRELPKGFSVFDFKIEFSRDSFPSLQLLGNTSYKHTYTENVAEYYTDAIIPASFDMPNLKQIGLDSFQGMINPARQDGKIVIYTDNQSLTSRNNYLINPIEDDGRPFRPFMQDDFIYSDAEKHTVIGLSPSGVLNLEKLDKATNLTEKIFNLPDNIVTVAENAFSSIQAPSITKIYAKNVETITSQAFCNLFGVQQIALDFPSVKNIVGSAVFFEQLSGAADSVTSTDYKVVLTDINMPNLERLSSNTFRYFKYGSLENPKDRVAFLNLRIGGNEYDYSYNNFTHFYAKEFYFPKLASATTIFMPYQGNIIKKVVLGKDTKLTGPKTFLRDYAFSDRKDSNKRASGNYAFVFTDTNHRYDNDDHNGVIYNPIKVTIRNIDENGNRIAADREKYLTDYTDTITGHESRTVYPNEIYGYEFLDTKIDIKNDNNDWTTMTNQQNYYEIPTDKSKPEYIITFRQRVNTVDQNVAKNGLDLVQDNEPIMKKPDGGTYPYTIGNAMLTTIKASITENTVDHPRIKVFYDPTNVEAVAATKYGLVANYVNNIESGVLTIDLNQMSGSTSVEIPIQWRFKKYVTPNNYELPIRAYISKVDNESEEISRVANTISLIGTYNQPTMLKNSPQNMPDYDYGLSKPYDDGIRYFGTYESVRKANGELINRIAKDEPVEFYYTVQNLNRNINELTVKDILPSYTYVNDDGTTTSAKATFIPEENPGWQLSDNDQLISHVSGFAGTVEINQYIPKLKLHFPHLLINENIVNHAELTLVPENKGNLENNIQVNDDISIYQPAETKSLFGFGDIAFWKNNRHEPWFYKQTYSDKGTTYFYDVQSDREKEIPFLVEVFSKAEQTKFKEVTITDYNLDERLYYTGIEVANDQWQRISEADLNLKSYADGDINTDPKLSQFKVIAYGDSGNPTMNPNSDPILQTLTVPMERGTKIYFDPKIAREIRYIQFVLPKEYEVNRYLLRFNVLTRLRNPDESVYDTTEGSLKNKFNNESLLAGIVTDKSGNNIYNNRSNPLSWVGRPYQSSWDGIAGSFLWHDEASVNIRPYQASVGLKKEQKVGTDALGNFQASPGTPVSYTLNLTPEIGDIPITENDWGFKLNNFRLVDIVPQGISIQNIILSDSFKNQPNARYLIIDNYEGTGKQAVVFTADTVNLGIKAVATIKTEVDVDIGNVQTIVNNAYLNFDNQKWYNAEVSSTNVYLKGERSSPTTDPTQQNRWAVASTEFTVVKNKEMVAKKYIRNTNGLWKTDIIDTTPNESFEYKLLLVNNAETDQKHISIMDMFPYKDDQFIQELNVGEGIRSPRLSEFHNYFDVTKPIQVKLDNVDLAASLYTIQYDNSTPYTYDYTGIYDIEGMNINWSSTAQRNTKAIRFIGTDGLVLHPGQKLEIILPMKAPDVTDINEQPALDSGQVAYNTFVRKDDDSLRYIEANKVGNKLVVNHQLKLTKFLRDGINGSITKANDTDKQAVFRIRSKDGSIEQFAKTDINGVVTFTNLPGEKDYEIAETKAPDGYIVAYKKLEVSSSQFGSGLTPGTLVISDDTSKEYFLNRKSILGSLTIHKKNDEGQALQGIRFLLTGTLTPLEGETTSRTFTPKTLITDRQGNIRVDNLFEGDYTLQEIVDDTTTDFETISPKNFTISGASPTNDITYDIVNNQVHVLLQKVGVKNETDLTSLANLTDSNRRKLPNYSFTITNQNNSQSIGTQTNENGQIMINGLRVNEVYKISEVHNAVSDSQLGNGNQGFMYNPREYYFYIDSNAKLVEVDNWNKENPRLFKQNVLNFPNLQKKIHRRIIIQKEDDEHHPIVGAVFGLYQNNQLVQKATTKLVDGKSIALFENMAPGTYILREIQAPSGYIASGNEKVITLPEDDRIDFTSPSENTTIFQNDQEVTYTYQKTMINHRIKIRAYKGELFLSNVSLETANRAKENNPSLIIQDLGNNFANVYQAIEGVEFKLYMQEGDSWTYLASYKTNTNGEIDLTNYNFDGTKRYQLIESQAAPGYQLDTVPMTIDLPLLSQSDDFTGDIQLYKANRKILGKILISKYEKLPTGEKRILTGAVFELYDSQGNLLKTATTNASGNAVFDQLNFGDYLIKERPMSGYKPNQTEHRIHIDQQNQNISLVYENEKIKTLSISVKKRWLGQPRFVNQSNPQDIQTKSIDSLSITVYVLTPVIADNGELVYKYYDIYLSKVLNNSNNFQETFDNLPELFDPYNRQYKITEYSPSYTNAETAIIGGRTQPVFREENKQLHKISGLEYYPYRPMLTSDFVTGNVTDGFTIVNAFEDLVSVGDYVFIDKNNNHLQDADEKGLAGVKVSITNADGSDPTYYNNEGTQVTAPYTTTTNEQGYYRFINLNPGEYKIHFELTPEQVNRGYVLVDKGDGTNPTIDSNANSDGWTDVFNLQPNANKTANPMGDYLDDPTIDAGVREGPPLVSLGDYVFIDTNGNHLQDSTDQPLAGVSVQVLRSDGSNPEWFNGTDFVTNPYITTTDATGHYQFTNLKPDTYKVQFTLTEAQSKLYAYVSPNVGDNDALDSDAVADHVNPSIGLTEAKAVSDLTIPQDTANAPNTLGLNNPTFDAGVTLRVDQLVSLGDKVFIDMDNSNTQTEGDLPLANVKVKVVNANNGPPTYLENDQLVTQEYTTTTDEQGYYHFDQLVPGNYKVIFELTPEQQQIYRFVTPDVGGNDALDSDAKVVNPAISYVAETSAQEVQPTTSPPDSPTAPNPLGLTNPSFDAGVRLEAEQLVSLGDYVFIDVDGSQTQTASDQPLLNVSVEVRTADGQLPTYLKNGQLVTDVYTTTTDLNGRYQFNHLLPGSYKVYFTLNEEQKSKYQFIAPNIGGDKTKDSDATVIDPLRPERAVTAADVVNDDVTIRNRADNPFHLDNPDFDAGVAVINQLVSVGDYVFIDRDGSNTQTSGDRPLPNVTVSIVKVNPNGTTTDPTYMKNGEMITASYITKTDADGLYSFVNLEPGDYQIIFTLTDAQKAVYHFITPEVGGAPSLDSDAHVVEGTDGKVGKSKVIHLVEDPFTRNGDNNPLHLDNPTIDAGVAGPDYELPGAGKMELWFWYLASISILAVGLICVFSRRKQQEMSVQAQAVTTMTSKRFTNIRQNTERFDIMDTGEVADVNTSSTYFADDQIRQSEVTVSNSQNNESSTNPIVAQEKDVGSSSQFGDVAVDDPPPEQSTKVKQNANDPFSSS